MPKLEKRLVNLGELNFDQSFLQFNVKKKNIWEELFKRIFSEHLTENTEY